MTKDSVSSGPVKGLSHSPFADLEPRERTSALRSAEQPEIPPERAAEASDRAAAFREMQTKWQRIWTERGVFVASLRTDRPKFYCYTPAPYVTGSLHVGHVRNYTYGDFLAKFKRLHGANVLYSIGFDSFGLPTEAASIRNGCGPAQWVEESIAAMRAQLSEMGFGFDWRRSFVTSDPSYYRWTQWIFLRMRERGLVYRREANSDWCPRCDVALARSQVAAGRCQICDSPVEARRVRQWYFRLGAYTRRLHADLGLVQDKNGVAHAGQMSLLQPHSGWSVPVRVPERDCEIVAFLPETACLTPDSPRSVQSRCESSKREQTLALMIHAEDAETLQRLGLDRDNVGLDHAGEMLYLGGDGITGGQATRTRLKGMVGDQLVPVYVSAGLDPIFTDQPALIALHTATGTGSSFFRVQLDGELPAPDFMTGTIPPLELNDPQLTPLTIYGQKDFSVSRQRVWGTPIPIVLCDACGDVPVPDEALPVLLPTMQEHDGRLVRRKDDDEGTRACPCCGGSARLEEQVMDCHFDALWHYCRPCVTPGGGFPFDDSEFRYWMPVDQIIFGRDTIPFLLDLRSFMKFLGDEGLVATPEFARETLAHGMILRDGRKMSKHLGNVVDPGEIARECGADALRFFVLARGNPKSDYDWSDAGVRRYTDLLGAFHDMVCAAACERAAVQDPARAANRRCVADVADDTSEHCLAGADDDASSVAPGKYELIFSKKVLREAASLDAFVESGRFDHYARAVTRLLTVLDVYWNREHPRAGREGKTLFWKTLEQVTVYLAPIAPHLAEECWERLGHRTTVFDATWPDTPLSNAPKASGVVRHPRIGWAGNDGG